MPIKNFHRRVAAVVLGVAAPHGFALGGGNALIAHGLIKRQTQDVDVFTNLQGGVEAAAGPVEAALQDAGLTTEREDKTGSLSDIFADMGQGLAEWTVGTPEGMRTVLQLSFFDRFRDPVAMDFGPVLDLEDVVGGKVCALASRIEPRDYVDTAAALRRYSVEELIGFATRLDPGLGDRDFREAGSRLDQWGHAVFAPYGLTPADVAELRERFADWPRA
jgi:Nucleotidyl transferase AbiEii toxin, Type IV TA system